MSIKTEIIEATKDYLKTIKEQLDYFKDRANAEAYDWVDMILDAVIESEE